MASNYKNSVTTTDATQTLIISVPIEDNVTKVAHITVNGNESGDRAGYYRRCTVYRAGGDAMLQGALDLPYEAESDVLWGGVAVGVSGNNFRVLVTGLAATTIVWNCELTLI